MFGAQLLNEDEDVLYDTNSSPFVFLGKGIRCGSVTTVGGALYICFRLPFDSFANNPILPFIKSPAGATMPTLAGLSKGPASGRYALWYRPSWTGGFKTGAKRTFQFFDESNTQSSTLATDTTLYPLPEVGDIVEFTNSSSVSLGITRTITDISHSLGTTGGTFAQNGGRTIDITFNSDPGITADFTIMRNLAKVPQALYAIYSSVGVSATFAYDQLLTNFDQYECYVFATLDGKPPTGTSFGIETYKANGTLTYSSNYAPLLISGVGTTVSDSGFLYSTDRATSFQTVNIVGTMPSNPAVFCPPLGVGTARTYGDTTGGGASAPAASTVTLAARKHPTLANKLSVCQGGFIARGLSRYSGSTATYEDRYMVIPEKILFIDHSLYD